MDGWTVLDRLKHDPQTRHIPVHIISTVEGRQRGLKQGALAFLEKPVTKEALDDAFAKLQAFVERRVKSLLVVEDDRTQRESIVELIGNGDVETTAVETGEEALDALRAGRFDCMVLDLGLPDMTGFDLIERIRGEAGLAELPIVVYTGKDLTPAEENLAEATGRYGHRQGRQVAGTPLRTRRPCSSTVSRRTCLPPKGRCSSRST